MCSDERKCAVMKAVFAVMNYKEIRGDVVESWQKVAKIPLFDHQNF